MNEFTERIMEKLIFCAISINSKVELTHLAIVEHIAHYILYTVKV